MELFLFIKGVIRQSRAKVLGTVRQYSLFSVSSGCLYNAVHPFRNFLAVLPPPPYTMLKLVKKILDTHVQQGWNLAVARSPVATKNVAAR